MVCAGLPWNINGAWRGGEGMSPVETGQDMCRGGEHQSFGRRGGKFPCHSCSKSSNRTVKPAALITSLQLRCPFGELDTQPYMSPCSIWCRGHSPGYRHWCVQLWTSWLAMYNSCSFNMRLTPKSRAAGTQLSMCVCVFARPQKRS